MADVLTGEPLRPPTGFNWVFLIELLVSGILCLFFLFFFNRLFATIISYIIRAYTWRKFEAYIDIEAIQISLLAGRVFFKGVRYHGHNETVYVHSGFITWRYWLFRVRKPGIFQAETETEKKKEACDQRPLEKSSSDDSPSEKRARTVSQAEKGGTSTAKELPCRITAVIYGVEIFFYNRSPAYDAVIESITGQEQGQNRNCLKTGDAPAEATETRSPSEGSNSNSSGTTASEKIQGFRELGKMFSSQAARIKKTGASVAPQLSQDQWSKPSPPAFLHLFPISAECHRGAIVLGNENTKSVIVTKVDGATGLLDAGAAGPHDVFEQILDFNVTHPIVQIKPNMDFKNMQLAAAAELKDMSKAEQEREPTRWSKLRPARLLQVLRRLTPRLHGTNGHDADSVRGVHQTKHQSAKAQALSSQAQWLGLSRYLEDNERDEHEEWNGIEYAKTPILADVPSLQFRFYWDVPGTVPYRLVAGNSALGVDLDDVNGSPPPRYGLDLVVRGGSVQYGPWADRHRINIQSIFFPALFSDARPAVALRPGETRVYTKFKISVDVQEDTVLRIATRESSKDWQWRGGAHNLLGKATTTQQEAQGKARNRKKRSGRGDKHKVMQGPDLRPYGWLDVKIFSDSIVRYNMDMTAGSSGYNNRVEVDIRGTEISSSVNHDLLWRSGRQLLECRLPLPLKWNGLRSWSFDVKSHDVELFLLRDHIFLFVDLVNDWTSGPPADFFTFTPFIYRVQAELFNFRLFLNTNDNNIINNPADFDDNNFVVIHSKWLHGDVNIPLDCFRPAQNEVVFDVQGRSLDLELRTTSKSTTHTYLEYNNLAQLGSIGLHGVSVLNAETSAAMTDTLYMEVEGTKLMVQLYGFLVRHFMKIKDNYFGEDLHFRTLEEFQGLEGGRVDRPGGPTKVTNDLDTILCIKAIDASVLLPSYMYKCNDSVRADVACVGADLRFTNYYMDLVVDSTPVNVSQGTMSFDNGKQENASSTTQMHIDSINIYGHRLFGLSPTEPTYLCNWDFDVGTISGECSTDMVDSIINSIRVFAFTLDDEENAMPIARPIVIPDVTFLRLQTRRNQVWLRVAQQVLLLRTGPIEVEYNDWAGLRFSGRSRVSIPELTMACVDAETAYSHNFTGARLAETQAYVQTSIILDMIQRKSDFTNQTTKQQDHIEFHDQRTKRADFLLLPPRRSRPIPKFIKAEVDLPAMPYPPMPEPLVRSQRTSLGDPSSPQSALAEHQARKQGRRSSSFSLRSIRRNKTESLLAATVGLHNRRQNSVSSSAVAGEHKENTRIHQTFLPGTTHSAPAFSLDLLDLDLSEVPEGPPRDSPPPRTRRSSGGSSVHVAEGAIDETSSQISFVVRLEPGICFYCKPQAITCIVDVIDALEPNTPEHLLDVFQMDVITEILNQGRRRRGQRQTIELSIDIPYTAFRLVNNFKQQTEGGSSMQQDRYDLNLGQLNLLARSRTPLGPAGHVNSISLHMTLATMTASIEEFGTNMEDNGLAVQASLVDTLFWLVSAPAPAVNLSFRTFDIAVVSRQIDYLASLIHRTTLLASEFESRFSKLIVRQQKRLATFVYNLVSMGSDTPDPPVLTKPSYLLRAAPEHLRNNDSWKIISRLRFIWQCATPGQAQALQHDAASDRPHPPRDAEVAVITALNRWRTWDLAHVQTSTAVRKLYGLKPGTADTRSRDPAPSSLCVRSRSIKLVIDPGPKQNELSFDVLAVDATESPPSLPSGLMLLETENRTHDTIVHVCTSHLRVKLTWEMCQLVEDVLRLFQERAPSVFEEKNPVFPVDLASNAPEDEIIHNFQFVFTTSAGKVDLDSINLSHTSTSEHLKLSIIAISMADSSQGISVSSVLHARSATSNMQSRSQSIWHLILEEPSVCVSYDGPGVDTATSPSVKVAAASKSLYFATKEGLSSILGLADDVLRDEISYIKKLSEMELPTLKPTRKVEDLERGRSVSQLTVVLFMDTYSIELALLRSLTYNLKGRIARLAAATGRPTASNYDFDFDLKTQQHSLHRDNRERQVISKLDVPPINGRVNLVRSSNEVSASVLLTIEKISLDAAAIQGLLVAVRTEEISEDLNVLQSDIQVLQRRAKDVFAANFSGQSEDAKQPAMRLRFIFTMYATLVGLDVVAHTPAKAANSSSAQMTLIMGTIQASVRHRAPGQDSTRVYPEIQVQVQAIGLNLSRVYHNDRRLVGNLAFGIFLQGYAQRTEKGSDIPAFRLSSPSLDVHLYAETAVTVLEVFDHLQVKFKELDLSKEMKYLRRLRRPTILPSLTKAEHPTHGHDEAPDSIEFGILQSHFALSLLNIRIAWVCGLTAATATRVNHVPNDLVLSFHTVNLSASKGKNARLTIENMALQMIPQTPESTDRPLNSAVMPEMVFNVAYESKSSERSLVFQAAGKSVDIQLDSRFLLPASELEHSISTAAKLFRKAAISREHSSTVPGLANRNPLGVKRLSNLIVDADFAGAVVRLSSKKSRERRRSMLHPQPLGQVPSQGRYGQFAGENAQTSTTLQAPGIALKIQFDGGAKSEPSLNVELKVNASSNTLYPTVVPLIFEISESVKEIVKDTDESESEDPALEKSGTQRFLDEEAVVGADPSTILGRTKLNIGVRICSQEFSMSCQPFARVAATAKFEDIYVTVNTIESSEHGHFFAISIAFTKLLVSVQHVYSRESSFSLDIDSIVLSLMNSKHLSGTSGVSAILRIEPTKTLINARQFQDFLVFREIWMPPEIRKPTKPGPQADVPESQEYLVQRYQQVAASAAFPWNATVAITHVAVDLDLGQSIGRSSFFVSKLWASSKKSTSWEQNLCIGIEKVGIQSSGRMSGFVELDNLGIRTSISWPEQDPQSSKTPLIQAAVGFDALRVKSAFDFQVFAIVNVTSFEFLMYNVRQDGVAADRLVAILDGDKFQVFCTVTSASQGLALYQAFERLVQEKQTAYNQALKDVERFLRRKSTVASSPRGSTETSLSRQATSQSQSKPSKMPISLQTDVVVTLRNVNLGAFPGTFFDSQVFKIEAEDIQTRFAVILENGKIHSGLGMTLGQLRVALSAVARPSLPKPIGDITVEDVVTAAMNARGGVILRVPQLRAAMQTWQVPEENNIEYTFNSSFEGRVDVGWNYSRISYIRGMWNAHSRALASRLGKPLPESAVKITSSGPRRKGGMGGAFRSDEQEKITAIVNVPQSKFQYRAVEPPIVDTPQLRDMGEATPPLEWIGLHKDRLPHVTHQIVIVGLLEVAKEVEDAYNRILGSKAR